MRRRYSARLALLGALVLAQLAIAEAGTVHGTVMNGTTGKAAAGIELTLVQLQGGMQEVAHSKSGTQGEFTFDYPGLGAQPMLVRAVYRGINFNHAVPPGATTAQVDIYEPSKDAKTISVPSHVVIFQPNGATLIVGEEYQIENKSRPPLAYFRSDGSFDFALPEKPALTSFDRRLITQAVTNLVKNATEAVESATTGADDGWRGRVDPSVLHAAPFATVRREQYRADHSTYFQRQLKRLDHHLRCDLRSQAKPAASKGADARRTAGWRRA